MDAGRAAGTGGLVVHATDDGEQLLFCGPLAVPAELLELAGDREAVMLPRPAPPVDYWEGEA
ncbi:MAG: hypothetical protein ACJ77E_17695 [Gaiellaceae bacterium]